MKYTIYNAAGNAAGNAARIAAAKSARIAAGNVVNGFRNTGLYF